MDDAEKTALKERRRLAKERRDAEWGHWHKTRMEQHVYPRFERVYEPENDYFYFVYVPDGQGEDPFRGALDRIR
jgi:aromatic ring-cleaving dioxygenase